MEDTLTTELERRLTSARRPSDLQTVFNTVAEEWLASQGKGVRYGPDLAGWADNEWKKRIRESLARSLESFNTPNTANTSKLFKRYLGVQIESCWSWHGVSGAAAKRRLDDLIALRGRVVHRGRTGDPRHTKVPDVQRSTVVRALNLVYFLVERTEIHLGIAPTID